LLFVIGYSEIIIRITGKRFRNNGMMEYWNDVKEKRPKSS
jgi:hypothetical protein